MLAALACLVPALACARTPVTAPPLAIPAAPVPEAVVALGRQYLATHPEDADRELLQRTLHLDASEPADAQLARIDAAIRRDLDDRDVVYIEGWQLTRTECRLYAALALA